MRYVKVLLFIVFFYFVMLFFVQNQAALSQSMSLRLDVMFLPPVESVPLSFYILMLVSFLVGGVYTLLMLVWDRLALSAQLGAARRRADSDRKELGKALETVESLRKDLDGALARAEAAEIRADGAQTRAGEAGPF
jgi:putative membrane protein/ATP adenylyltransferase